MYQLHLTKKLFAFMAIICFSWTLCAQDEDGYTIVWKGKANCYGSDGYFAYRFFVNGQVRFRDSFCDNAMVVFLNRENRNIGRVMSGTLYDINSINFESGNIPVRWSYNGEIKYIPIPQEILDARNALYQKALSGTIYDLFEYENTYKDNTAVKSQALQERKEKMFYTSEFFDAKSEEYKRNLYEKNFLEANNWRLKMEFRQRYEQYDPQKYIAAFPPLDICMKLVAIHDGARRSRSIPELESLIKEYPKYQAHFKELITIYEKEEREEAERKRQDAMTRAYYCEKCEVDWANTNLLAKNGYITLKNGNRGSVWYDKGWRCSIIMIAERIYQYKTFNSTNEMVDLILERCREIYCK